MDDTISFPDYNFLMKIQDVQSAGFTFRRLKSISEISPLEELQRVIWGYGSDGFDSVYPTRALYALSESGGHISGAYSLDRLVGFSLAWIGKDETTGEIYLQSQLLGVLPEFRGLNLGFHLKVRQKDFALAQGIQQIRWTFDPLQASNAKLNLNKLGAICRRFLPEYYGNLRSQLVHGSSDRLLAEWIVTSDRVKRILDQGEQSRFIPGIPIALSCSTKTFDTKRLRVPVKLNLDLTFPETLIEIPVSLALVAETDTYLLKKWRLKVGKALRFYLGNDYIIEDLWIENSEYGKLAFYYLKCPASLTR